MFILALTNSLKKYLFTYFWLCWTFVAARETLGFSSCGEQGLPFVAVEAHSLLITVASLVSEHRL